MSIFDLVLALQIMVLLYVAVTDLGWRQISNFSCIILACIGFVFRLVTAGPLGFIDTGTVLVPLSILLVFCHVRGWIGGGDVKLLLALGIGLSSSQIFSLIFVMSVAGLMLASVHLAMRYLPYPRRPRVNAWRCRRIYAVERWRCIRRAPLPYGVAIAAAGIWIFLINHGA